MDLFFPMLMAFCSIVVGLLFFHFDFIKVEHEERWERRRIIMCLMMMVSEVAIVLVLTLVDQLSWNTILLTVLLASILWPVTWWDLWQHKIPNKILVIGLVLRIAVFLVEAITNIQIAAMLGIYALAAAGAMMLGAALCKLLSPASVGAGDIKLLVIMGLYLGADKIGAVIMPGLLVLFFFAIFMLLVKKADRKKELPFAPFMLIGLLVGVFAFGV